MPDNDKLIDTDNGHAIYQCTVAVKYLLGSLCNDFPKFTVGSARAHLERARDELTAAIDILDGNLHRANPQ